MNIRHNRHVAPRSSQTGHDILQIGRIFDRRRGNSHHLATHRHQVERLLDRGLGIHRVAGNHRLHPDRIRAANAHFPDHHIPRRTANRMSCGMGKGKIHRREQSPKTKFYATFRIAFHPSCTPR